ncbi:hypothetical protein BDN71DRAFT_107014 [Pleurotus eryngii]|uniref:Ribonuclease H1 N-terminal domain-containing protein n=1 Tax=Pleurotus eryngii TaxID=5323 RepID=A0A9P5ZSG1_PLEER|nr:hypothetical protein BDN71DRAFT_107014 [Pleurotus eryngii]
MIEYKDISLLLQPLHTSIRRSCLTSYSLPSHLQSLALFNTECFPLAPECMSPNSYWWNHQQYYRWYAVVIGREVGVFQHWHHNVEPLVTNVPGWLCRGFSFADAETIFLSACTLPVFINSVVPPPSSCRYVVICNVIPST